MARPEWTKLCKSRDLRVEDDDVEVELAAGRRHRVRVTETEDAYELRAIVAKRAVVEQLEDLALQAWVKNRAVQLVGFRIDDRGRLVGEGWVPKAGLRAEEMQHYLRRVARECDRLEYVLTGRDVE